MASKVRALWRSGDGMTKYFMIGGALAVPTSVGTGVVAVYEGAYAHEGAAAGLFVGAATALFWPVGVAWAALYVPLKGLELLRKHK